MEIHVVRNCPSFKFTIFRKYITFNSTKLSAVSLDDTNKKKHILTFISIILNSDNIKLRNQALFYLCKSVHLQ